MHLHLRTVRHKIYNSIIAFIFLIDLCGGKVIDARNLDFVSNANPIGLKFSDDKEDKPENVLNINKLKTEDLKSINTTKLSDNSNIDNKNDYNDTRVRKENQSADDINITSKINNLRMELNDNLILNKNQNPIQRLTKITSLLENVKTLLKKETQKNKYKYEFKEYVPVDDSISNANLIRTQKTSNGLILIPEFEGNKMYIKKYYN